MEGGIRVPFLIRWPDNIQPNSAYELPISILDILPTFYAAGGGNVEDLKENDWVYLLPFLQGKESVRPLEKIFRSVNGHFNVKVEVVFFYKA